MHFALLDDARSAVMDVVTLAVHRVVGPYQFKRFGTQDLWSTFHAGTTFFFLTDTNHHVFFFDVSQRRRISQEHSLEMLHYDKNGKYIAAPCDAICKGFTHLAFLKF